MPTHVPIPTRGREPPPAAPGCSAADAAEAAAESARPGPLTGTAVNVECGKAKTSQPYGPRMVPGFGGKTLFAEKQNVGTDAKTEKAKPKKAKKDGEEKKAYGTIPHVG